MKNLDNLTYLYATTDLFDIYNVNMHKDMSKQFNTINELFEDIKYGDTYLGMLSEKLGFKEKHGIFYELTFGSLRIRRYGDDLFMDSGMLEKYEDFYYSNYAEFDNTKSMDLVEFIDKFVELYNMELDWLRYQSSSMEDGAA